MKARMREREIDYGLNIILVSFQVCMLPLHHPGKTMSYDPGSFVFDVRSTEREDHPCKKSHNKIYTSLLKYLRLSYWSFGILNTILFLFNYKQTGIIEQSYMHWILSKTVSYA